MKIQASKSKILIFFVFLFFFLSFFSSFNLSFAQENGQLKYNVLAPLPGTTVVENCTGPNCEANLKSYIPGLFYLIIFAVAVLAVVRIVYGGVLYITTDAIQGKSDGKNIIIEAIWGLVLISISWFILYNINPRLVNIDFSITPSKIEDRFPLEGEAGVQKAPTTACTSCVAMVGLTSLSISTSANKYIEPDTFERLKILDKNIKTAGLTGTISEGYNPSGHQNSCHTNATCIDLNLPNENATNVKKIVDTAQDSGLRAIFEVKTQKRKTDIIAGACGVGTLNVACVENMNKNIMVLPDKTDPKTGEVKPQITGEHFSVYNCQKDPPSCSTFP